ncbi:MAG: acyl-CoA dehydrogenase [Anaerolineae bacterium]|nr:acyl-CoA/acyl-ACP dehydrogenase [Anaerolineales bacterium]MCQ3977173.1 acyl-CoA dehydrogenase [Anaerolineae bacterium]
MYRLTSDQQVIVAQAREIAEKSIGPNADKTDSEGRFPQESIDALAAAGFLGLTIAPEYGGRGQGLRVACAVIEEIAQRCPSTAMVYMMHLCGVATYSAAADKTADYLRAAAAGKHLSTLAWSEKGSRSQFWAPVSQAVRNNGVVRLSAEKSWVTSAGHADGYVVSTQWADAQSPLQSMLYLVLREDQGVSVAGPWTALGMRGNASAPMKLESVAVGPEHTLSEEGKGLDMMLGVVLPVFQLCQAAIAVGISEAAVQTTQGHLTGQSFAHSNSKLADLPNLRARLAEMRIETDKARAHLVSVIDAVENPGPLTQLLVLETKAAAGETAVRVTDIGMRACGGAAFSKHLGLERYFRDARAAIVMAPTTDHIYDFIGRALCGMEVF